MEKVDKDTAEREFEKFIERMDLDVSPEGMDNEELASFRDSRRRFIDAVQDGRLCVNDNGEPVFTPGTGNDMSPVTFYEPDGAALLAADSAKKNHDMEKTVLLLCAITKTNKDRFAKMPGRELKVCLAIVALLLGG
jgi:hypothetical protein